MKTVMATLFIYIAPLSSVGKFLQ